MRRILGFFAVGLVACGSSSSGGAAPADSSTSDAPTDSTISDAGGDETNAVDASSDVGGDTGTPEPTGYAIGYATCPAAAGGTQYTIGLLDGAGNPSGPQTIADFTHWNDLKAGDVVCIYGKSAPYAERLVLTRGGSDDAHRIRIVGVVQNGHEPILSGKNATTAAAFDYGTNISTYYLGGEVSITGLSFGAPVSYLNVEGLTIQDATTADVGGTADKPTYSVNSYSDPNLNGGKPTPWGCGSAGVNVIRADHVSIAHDRIRNNDNGIFVNSNNGNTSSNVLVTANHIYGNGVYGEQQGAWNPGKCTLDAHGVYTEASNITYLGNRFGALKQGEPTNQLKDRSSGLIVANNFFAGDGALERTLGDALLVGAAPHGFGHVLDLVESYDSSVGFNTLGAAYDNVSVFGNVFFDDSAGAGAEEGTTVPIHFGGDQGAPAVYRHHLHFFNNTVVARRDAASSSGTFGWFEMETNTFAEAWNNVFYASANQTTQAQAFVLLNTYCYNKPCGSLADSPQNWLSPAWGILGVNGSATDPHFVDLAKGDVHIATNDPTIVGNGQPGNSAYPANATTLPDQYKDYLSSEPRPFSQAKIDLGAFGYKAP